MMGVRKGSRSAGTKAAPIRAQRTRGARVAKRTILDKVRPLLCLWVVFSAITAAFAIWSWLNPL